MAKTAFHVVASPKGEVFLKDPLEEAVGTSLRFRYSGFRVGVWGFQGHSHENCGRLSD